MAGAAHLLDSNTGDLRSDQCEWKSHVESKSKNFFDINHKFRLVYRKFWPSDPLDIFNNEAIGVRKVTTGITGLWRPSVHSDVAF